MDALAEIWSRSGERDEHLYKGDDDEIIRELKAWIVARKARNQANIKLLWDIFETYDAILGFRDQYGTLEDLRIIPLKTKHVKNVERVEELKEERDKLTRLAWFLIRTLSRRGLTWWGILATSQWTEMDSEVCAFLKKKDPSFDAEKQLEILEMQHEIGEWRLEHARRKAVPHTYPTAAVGWYESQEDVRKNLANYDLPAPIDIRDLLPSPHDKDSPMGRSSSKPIKTVKEEPSESRKTAKPDAIKFNSINTTEERAETEETAEAIDLKINSMDIADEKAKVGKMSKAKGYPEKEG